MRSGQRELGQRWARSGRGVGRPLRSWAVVLALLLQPAAARAADLAGTALIFSGVENIDKDEDFHHSIKAGGTRKLKGSSCCTYLVVAFPTSAAFELRADGSPIATGAAQQRGGGVVLVPDANSLEILRWWAENEIEEHWNAGVFALDLSLRLRRLSRAKLAIKLRTTGGQPKGLLKMALRLGGEVQHVDPTRIIDNRFGPGPAKVTASVRALYRATVPITDLETSYPYPPEVPCDEEFFSRGLRADYCYEP